MSKITPWQPTPVTSGDASAARGTALIADPDLGGAALLHSTSDGTAWSMERRLPLLIFALLAAVVLAFGIATYREVRTSAITQAMALLTGVTRELAVNMSRSSAPRAPLVELSVGRAVQRALPVGGPVDSLATALAALERRTDTTLVSMGLWTADGVLRYVTRPLPTVQDSVVLAATIGAVQRSASSQRSVLYGAGDRVHVWSALPVRAGGRIIGVVAELRLLGRSPRTEAQLRELTGEEVSVLIASRGSSEWVSLRGHSVPPPFALVAREGQAVRVIDTAGVAHYALHQSVAGTPWRVVLSQSEASILRRPHQFLRTLLVIGLLLLTVGTIGAWMVSRRLTKPLADLGRAAEAMARGDYTQRVQVRGGAELVRLARSFNAMGERIGDAHAVLGHQNAALQRANESKARFLAMMSHELRTPLNAIGGYAELIALGVRGPTTPAQVEDLVRIRRNKDQLLNIIADILHFSRVDPGHVGVRLEDVHVPDAFGRLMDTMGNQFDQKGVTLQLVPAPIVVRADPARLQQVLLNLVTNAYSFTAPGGRVRVCAEAHGQWTHITVSDTGIGIPREKLAAIFEPFVQVDASLTRKVGGTGLGLSIARELTVAMGGTVSVESVPNEGSTFTVILPTAAHAPMDDASYSLATAATVSVN